MWQELFSPNAGLSSQDLSAVSMILPKSFTIEALSKLLMYGNYAKAKAEAQSTTGMVIKLGVSCVILSLSSIKRSEKVCSTRVQLSLTFQCSRGTTPQGVGAALSVHKEE